MHRHRPSVRALVVLLLPLLVGAFPIHAAPASFESIHAFGDSLTDTGRNPAPAGTHYAGRWSNGSLWVERLSGLLGFPYQSTNNHARAGAETGDLPAQLVHMGAPDRPETALFVVWIGGNDIINNVQAVGLDDARWNQIISAAVGRISNAVARLQAAGARSVLVGNVPDISLVPAVRTYLSSVPFLSGLLTAYAQLKIQEFNGQIEASLTALAAAHPQLSILRFDTYAFSHELADNPAAHGFTKNFPDALGDPALTDKSFGGPGANYLFWDPLHPTAKVHTLVADRFLALLPKASRPVLAIRKDGDTLEFSFGDLAPGTLYGLESSPNLSGWAEALTLRAESPSTTLRVAIDPRPALFYRLRAK